MTGGGQEAKVKMSLERKRERERCGWKSAFVSLERSRETQERRGKRKAWWTMIDPNGQSGSSISYACQGRRKRITGKGRESQEEEEEEDEAR